MPFADPSPTQVDLHFRLFGFPVRIHPFFWLVCVFTHGRNNPAGLPLWIIAVLISIVVHELGHAVLQRRYGGYPRIVLYALGGLAITDSYAYSPWRSIAISLAGPVAGFLLGGLIYAVLPLLPLLTPAIAGFLYDMLWINLVWGCFNLLPIYPLDGGQATRELLTMAMRRTDRAVVYSLWLSIFTCALAGAWVFYVTGSWWNMLLLIVIAVNNYQTLEGYRWSRRGGY